MVIDHVGILTMNRPTDITLNMSSTIKDFRNMDEIYPLGFLQNKHICFYCEESFKSVLIFKTIDHLVPLSKRGNDSVWNKVYACNKCNQLKGNSSLYNFLLKIKWLYGKDKIVDYKYFIMHSNIEHAIAYYRIMHLKMTK
jgi:hypothetical protein